jgi:hypothetical protein
MSIAFCATPSTALWTPPHLILDEKLRRPGRYQQVKDNLEVKDVTVVPGSEQRRFVLVRNPAEPGRERRLGRLLSEIERLNDRRSIWVTVRSLSCTVVRVSVPGEGTAASVVLPRRTAAEGGGTDADDGGNGAQAAPARPASRDATRMRYMSGDPLRPRRRTCTPRQTCQVRVRGTASP